MPPLKLMRVLGARCAGSRGSALSKGVAKQNERQASGCLVVGNSAHVARLHNPHPAPTVNDRLRGRQMLRHEHRTAIACTGAVGSGMTRIARPSAEQTATQLGRKASVHGEPACVSKNFESGNSMSRQRRTTSHQAACIRNEKHSSLLQVRGNSCVRLSHTRMETTSTGTHDDHETATAFARSVGETRHSTGRVA